MSQSSKMRTYVRRDCVVFCKTNEDFGGLSNMAGGFPIVVNDVRIRTSEALYQACRFPHLPDVQKLIIDQHSPMAAKMATAPYRENSRSDWMRISVNVMRWSLRAKLAQNWDKFKELLLSTGDMPIVELSYKSDFWGAKPNSNGELIGMNVLGRLLMELRGQLKLDNGLLIRVEPMTIPDFLLFGEPISVIEAPLPGLDHKPVKRVINETQLSLFGDSNEANTSTAAPVNPPAESIINNFADEQPADVIVGVQIDVFTDLGETETTIVEAVDLPIESLADNFLDMPASEVIDDHSNMPTDQPIASAITDREHSDQVSDDLWVNMIVKMNIFGLTKELAMNCTLKSIDDESCSLAIDPKYKRLRNSRTESLLKKSIQDYCSSPLTLVMVVEKAIMDTPSEKAIKDHRLKQQMTIDNIDTDENIMELRRLFGARIVPGTIEPICVEQSDSCDTPSF